MKLETTSDTCILLGVDHIRNIPWASKPPMCSLAKVLSKWHPVAKSPVPWSENGTQARWVNRLEISRKMIIDVSNISCRLNGGRTFSVKFKTQILRVETKYDPIRIPVAGGH